ncbi:MAG: VCBS domain-containing protein [Beijerinckiaceae bacterium]|nr:VCBS domain-containing protein [Beijerinckiaceae bacterium]
MSFSGKFDAELPIDGLGAHLGGPVNLQAVASHVPSGAIIVPDAHLLFTGDFKRTGVDLIISKDDRELLVADYFKSEKRAALSSPDGAHLSGDIVNALTGHVQLAQADGGASVSKVIGHVTKVTGSATAIRNGVSIVLNVGDLVEKGDVVLAGSNSTLGITFIDGTVFGLSSNARMVLNEMIYDPAGSNNSALLSLVQGTISFVAGEAAKHGNMKVDTPVATMGIRGTAVLVEIDFEVRAGGNAPPVKFQVLIEPNGTTGSYILYDKATLNPIATVSQAGTQTIISGGGDVSFLASAPLSPEAQNIITEVFSQKFTSTDAIPKSQFASGSSVNNLADIGPSIRAANSDAFNLTLLALNTGKNSTASIEDHAAEMLFFLRETRAAPSLVEDSVPSNVNLSTEGAVAFSDVGLIQSATIALKSSTSNPHLPGLIDNSGLGTVAIGEILFGLNNSWAVGWSFTIPNNDPVLQSLAMGQTLTQTYTITINNGQTQDVVVTLIGTNDAPTIVSSSTNAVLVTEDSVGAEINPATVGTITFQDVDLIDSHQAAVALKSSTSSAHLPGFIDNVSQIGTFSLTSGVSEITTDTISTGQVSWSFSIADNNPILQSLAKGQTLTQVYTIIITDNNGAVATQDVTVSLIGTNDPIVITYEDLLGAVTEPATPAGNLTNSGVIGFTDVDLVDVHLASATGTPIGSVLGTLTVVKDSDSTGTGTGGQLTWTYAVADSAVAYLAAGQTKVESFTFTLTDQNGSVITRQIDVTITGTNDGASITGTATGAVAEDGTLTAGGTLTVADPDSGENHFQTPASLAGIYGAFTFDPNTGVWGYTLNNEAVQALGAGQVVHDRLTVTSADGSASEQIDVTVTGTNDGASITGTATGAVAEDGTLTAGGTLTVADPDSGQNHFQTPASLAGSYGVFSFDPNTGVWGYTLNNEAVQALSAGQVVHDTLTVTSADGSASEQIDVTITGTNDGASITGTATGAVAEDGTLTAGGTLTVADPDSGENHFQTPASLAGSYGVFSFDPNTGVWGYTLNNAAAQALGAGQVVHDTLTVTSADGSASQQIDVTITGSNDAPVVQGGTHRVSNITQNSGQLVFDGQHFFGDDELTVTDLDGPLVGIAVIGFDNANGSWQYQLSGTNDWTDITLSSGQALLLSAGDRVRYNGDASQTAEALTFKAWDGSDGSTSGDIILISDVGGSSAFSAGTYTVVTKNSNDAPAGAGEPTSFSLTEPSTDLGTMAMVTFEDAPTNSTLDSGVRDADGSWKMQTTDVTSLSTTSPGELTLSDAGASGDGSAIIDGSATLVLQSSAIANVVFGSGTGGTLKLEDSFHFNGTISGFDGSDIIDLVDVDFGTASISYQANDTATGGTLSISDGAQVVSLSLLGHYSADNFTIVSDQLKGTSVAYVSYDLVM